MKSIPASAMSAICVIVSSKVAELWSAEFSLMPIAKVDGTTLRVCERISRTKRVRFSAVPPYASVRRFVCG